MSSTKAALGSRARSALLGLAVGDALGMPTQFLSRDTISSRYGILSQFYEGPPDNDISAGVPAARVTDDTDQAIILGRHLLAGSGHIDVEQFVQALLAWESQMRDIGSHDLLGPSTIKALKLAADGVPTTETGRWGDTNGASMRIAPVGIAFSSERLVELVDAVEQVSHVTHNTGIAIAGASAVAAAISCGIDGYPMEVSFARALDAAQLGGRRGHYMAGADVAARIRWAVDLVKGRDPSVALQTIYELVGVGVATQEAVPAAFAVAALFPDDPWGACRHAASLGGDCDTIAAIAGSIVGAHATTESFPKKIVEQLNTTNPDLRLESLADELLGLRFLLASKNSVCVR